MKIARFMTTGGRVLTGVMRDVQCAWPLKGPLLTGGDAALQCEDKVVPIERLMAPLEPTNIFGVGRNYEEHIKETAAQRPERPLVFMKPTSAISGSDAWIELPEAAPQQVDFEAELAVIIGRTARNVSVEQAREHILGYTCANDVTARDCQATEQQWVRAKGFDTFCPLGPWIVTADSFDPTNRKVVSRLNGVVMQESWTAEMILSPFELVSYLSQQFTLSPGTVILTGTPAGVGFVRQPPVFLRDGDIIEVEIEGIGTLANEVMYGREPSSERR